jgi:hypothetical protein
MPPLGPQPIKRPRPSLNCLVCRDRKVRCGREQPECTNCKKMGRECVYQIGLSSQHSVRQGVPQTRHSVEKEPSSRISDPLPTKSADDESRPRQITSSFFGLVSETDSNITCLLLTLSSKISETPSLTLTMIPRTTPSRHILIF